MLTVTDRVAGQQRAAAVRLGGSVTDEQGRARGRSQHRRLRRRRKPHGTVGRRRGRFVFDCPAGASEFRVRMLGYRERVVKIVAGKSSYDVRLTESSENVADVVVTGYDEKKKESYTAPRTSYAGMRRSYGAHQRAEHHSTAHAGVRNLRRHRQRLRPQQGPRYGAARPQQFHRGRPDQCPAFHPRRDGGGHLLCFRYAFGRHRVDLGAERCRGDFVLRLESRQRG